MTDQPKLTPYWQRIVTAAESILLGRIEALNEQTVDPSVCLLPEDKLTMAFRQDSADGCRGRLETIREGSRAGKALALGTVLFSRPGLLFK